jgi:hypothetical protein
MGIIQAGDDTAAFEVHGLAIFARMKHIPRGGIIAEIEDVPSIRNQRRSTGLARIQGIDLAAKQNQNGHQHLTAVVG